MVGAISGVRPGRAETVTATAPGTGAGVSHPKRDAVSSRRGLHAHWGPREVLTNQPKASRYLSSPRRPRRLDKTCKRHSNFLSGLEEEVAAAAAAASAEFCQTMS
jgi:hypothetical protein